MGEHYCWRLEESASSSENISLGKEVLSRETRGLRVNHQKDKEPLDTRSKKHSLHWPPSSLMHPYRLHMQPRFCSDYSAALAYPPGRAFLLAALMQRETPTLSNCSLAWISVLRFADQHWPSSLALLVGRTPFFAWGSPPPDSSRPEKLQKWP